MNTEESGRLQCQKREFSLPEDVRYLNCAYMSPLPRVAEEAGVRGMRREGTPTGIDSSDFFNPGDQIRRRFARLVDADDPNRVALIPSVSYGVAVAARNLAVEKGHGHWYQEEHFSLGLLLLEMPEDLFVVGLPLFLKIGLLLI